MDKERLIDLDEKQFRLLEEIIKLYIPNRTVWAYGSRVTWKAGEASDLDLAVFGCDSQEIYNFKDALQESDLLISVDVMNWETIPDNFKENIKRKYVVLQESSTPEGWREVKLEEVAEITMGQSPKSDTYNTDNIGLPFYQGVVDFSDRFVTPRVYCSEPKKIIEPGDILLSVRAPVGRVNFTKNKCSIGRGNAGLRHKQGMQNFLFYVLRNFEHKLHESSSGSVFSSISKSDIQNLEFLCPPLSEQKAIAEVLSSLDDKIDLLHRQNKTLENMAQTLFRQWFVEEAEEGWGTATLLDEFDVVMGQSPPGNSYNEEGIGIPMFQGNADFGFRFPQNRVYTTESRRLARRFDTLVSVRAPVGEQNMAKEKCCIGRGVASFRYKSNSGYYTYTYFKLKSLMDKIRQFNDEGTVFGSISKTDFQQMETVLPSKELVEQFEREAKSVNDRIIENCHQIDTLENLRDALLPKLMSGKTRVKALELVSGEIL